MESFFLVEKPFPKHPSLDDYRKGFFSFIDSLQQHSIDYPKEYKHLMEQIKPQQKSLLTDSPTISEIRTNYEVFLHRKNKSQKEESGQILKYWSYKHLVVFFFLLACYQAIHKKSIENMPDTGWHFLSTLLPYTNAEILKYKWTSLKAKQTKLNNNWTKQEDDALKIVLREKHPDLFQSPLNNSSNNNGNYHSRNNIKWSFIAMEMNQRLQNNENFLPKLGKHCRERWFNHLTPLLRKNEWNDSDDLCLLQLAIKHNRKWSRIARNFPGRTQHSVKNRFLSLIAREYKISRKKLSPKLVSNIFLHENTLHSLKKKLQDDQTEEPFYNNAMVGMETGENEEEVPLKQEFEEEKDEEELLEGRQDLDEIFFENNSDILSDIEENNSDIEEEKISRLDFPFEKNPNIEVLYGETLENEGLPNIKMETEMNFLVSEKN